MLANCIYTVNILYYYLCNYSNLNNNRQLWENYTRKSGDGLSMTFLVIWLAGDVFNLLGVIMQDLLVTMV